MKKTLLIVLLLYALKSTAQDVIYLVDGTKIPGKVAEITPEKVKFKNLANPNGPFYSRSSGNVQVAFNATGDYLVFAAATPLTDKEKDEFINAPGKPRPFDVLVDGNGKILPVNITDESETEILANSKGTDVKLSKTSLVFMIRKNGTHQFFSTVETALPYLAIDKSKINALYNQPLVQPKNVAKVATTTTTTISTATATAIAPAKPVTLTHNSDELVVPDMALFGTKALAKVKEFTGYVQAITNVSTDRDAAVKSISQAVALFLNEEARVEVSNLNSKVKNKYKIGDYLNRLMIRAGQYDKVETEFANINYASKFKKGEDGNYYGSVTFVQKFQGFVDGNLVYGDQTKRNVTIVLKYYEKSVNGGKVAGWDVFLDDIGVVETRKL